MPRVSPAMRMPAGGLTGAVAVPLFVESGLVMVSSFVTVVHTPPATFAPNELPLDSDVRPHPHIGIATLTYLLAGSMTHRDAAGGFAEYAPGDLGLMVSGRGVAHSERYDALRRAGGTIEGFQLWVALSDEAAEPSFSFWRAERLPWVEQAGARLKLLAGRLGGALSPVPVPAPLFLADVILPPGSAFDLPADYRDRAAYVVAGAVGCGDQRVEAGNTMLFAPGEQVRLVAREAARLLCFGGEPVAERWLWWNLVASDPSSIEAGKAAWREGRLPLPDGDDADFTSCPADNERALLRLSSYVALASGVAPPVAPVN